MYPDTDTLYLTAKSRGLKSRKLDQWQYDQVKIGWDYVRKELKRFEVRVISLSKLNLTPDSDEKTQ